MDGRCSESDTSESVSQETDDSDYGVPRNDTDSFRTFCHHLSFWFSFCVHFRLLFSISHVRLSCTDELFSARQSLHRDFRPAIRLSVKA